MNQTILSAKLSQDGLQITYQKGQVKEVLLKQVNVRGQRPYIHPIVLPGTTFELTQNAPAHHPWQHGLYFAYHGINGSDFWLDHGEGVGHYSENDTALISQEPHLISWQTSCKGIHQNGTELFKEKITWTLTYKLGRIHLKTQYEMKALIDLKIDQCLYGGLFLRMPWQKDLSVFVENSAGDFGLETEQKKAEWLDMRSQWGSPNHQEYGVLIQQHPEEGKEIVPWRVDKNYGVGPSEVIQGPLYISQGASLRLFYSLVFYAGQLSQKERSEILNQSQEVSHV